MRYETCAWCGKPIDTSKGGYGGVGKDSYHGECQILYNEHVRETNGERHRLFVSLGLVGNVGGQYSVTVWTRDGCEWNESTWMVDGELTAEDGSRLEEAIAKLPLATEMADDDDMTVVVGLCRQEPSDSRLSLTDTLALLSKLG